MAHQPSSAETAKEIQSQLSALRKSRNLRQKKSADQSSLDRADALTLDKLRRIFARLHDDGSFHCDPAEKDSVSGKWSAWLNSQLDQFIVMLVEHISDDKMYALRTFCGVIASFPDVVTNEEEKREMLSERLLTKLVEAVCKSRKCFDANLVQDRSADEALLTLLDSEFIQQYRDVQYYVLMVLQKLAARLIDEKEKNDKASGGNENNQTKDYEVEQNVEVVAENMARLLLKMDYIAKSHQDLVDNASSLFAPPALDAEDVIGKEQDENESESDGETSESEASDDDEGDHEQSEQHALAGTSKPFTKHPKKSKIASWQNAYKHRNALQEAWLTVLRLTIPPRTTKLILHHLSTYILPIVPTPLRFAEYFTRSFRNGTIASNANSNNNGLAAILSLHGLFQLILNHQLEYPSFYPSLYKLLHPRILYTKHRTRFLRLLSKSLMSNTMLPAYVVAAFCKKLLRLGLSGPPSGALFVIALVSNLIRKHGEVACLIHRKGGDMMDVFVEDADDLIGTRGMIDCYLFHTKCLC